MLLKTIAAGATTTFQTNYLGNQLMLKSSADIIAAVKVVPLGDGVLLDLDAAGVEDVGKADFINPGSHLVKILTLSDGLVAAKVVDITVQNTGTADLEIYMPVFQKGSMYVQTMQQTVLAASQSVFSDFEKMFMPLLKENDRITVDFADGASHTFDGNELALLTYVQQTDEMCMIDNSDGVVKKVTIIPNTDSRVYLTRFMAVTNL
jgi:hypothetical protein